MATKNLRDGALVIKDNDSNSHAVALDFGDLKFSRARQVIHVDDRGSFDHLRLGDDQPVPVSWSCKFVDFYTTGVTMYEMLTGESGASGYVYTKQGSSISDAADVSVVSLEFTITDPTSGSELITIDDFAWETIEFTEGDPDTLTVSGKAYSVPAIS